MVHSPSSTVSRQSLRQSRSDLFDPSSSIASMLEDSISSLSCSSSSSSPSIHPEEDSHEICVICLENPRTTRLSCGHEIMCRRCALVVMKTKTTCPTCRARITKVMFSKVFGQTDFVPTHEDFDKKTETELALSDKFIEQRVSHEVARRRSIDENKLVLDGACRVADQLKRVCVKLTAATCLVTYLSLADNFIGPAEAVMLGDALSRNSSIRFLNISSNCLGNEGTRIICEALSKNKTITTIHLNANHMEAEGAEALAKLLETNETIEVLRLYENAIGDKGVKALSKALKTNYTLKELSLRSNRISTKSLHYLAKKLHLNSKLNKLDIGFNSKVNRKEFPSRIDLTYTPMR